MSAEAVVAVLTSKGWVAAAVIVGWIARHHIAEDREGFKSLSERLRALEADRVVKTDLDRVYDRVEDIGKQVADNHSEIMGHLLNVKR